MGRERKLQSHILSVGILISVICASGCSRLEERCGNVTISFHCTDPETRSALPDEDLITDISLMIFDESGYAEDCLWLGNGTRSCISRLVVDKRYTFCACANFGYQIYADHIDELQEIKYYLAYPDEYREGIPMYAEEELMVTGDETIEIGLRRLMAKISLSMDRSRLDDDVEMKVRAVKIGNCPRSVTPFRESRTLSGDDSFEGGVQVMDASLVKGLEFDCVLIADAEAAVYPDERFYAKLFYVLCTRPLHRLAFLHAGERTHHLDQAFGGEEA